MSKLFVMYIGTQFDKSHVAINESERNTSIRVLKDKLASDFGGYSVGEVKGGYHHANGELAEESAIRVEVTASEQQVAHIKECAAMFRDLFRQESILLNCTTIESNFI